MVLFPDLRKSAKLPEGEEVTLEFTPDQPGEYDFQCQLRENRPALTKHPWLYREGQGRFIY